MANGLGYNPMFANQMSCPSCGYTPGSTVSPTAFGYGMNPQFGGFWGPNYPYGSYGSAWTGSGGFGPNFYGNQNFPYNPMWMGMGTGMGPGPMMMGQPFGFNPGFMPYGPGFMPSYGPWFGGPMTWGGTFPGMYGGAGWQGTEGWASDDQIVDMIYDSIDADPVIPYDSDISVDVTGGVVTLSGTVPNKRIKHAVGDDAWWVPGVWDVNNNLEVSGRRERMSTRTGGERMGGTTRSKMPTGKSTTTSTTTGEKHTK